MTEILVPRLTGNPSDDASYIGAGTGALGTPGSGGSGAWPTNFRTVASAPASVAAGDFILANAVAGGFTVPAPAAPNVGDKFGVKKTDASTNAVAVSGTIDGDAAGASINVQNYGIVCEWDGTDWKIVAVTSAAGVTYYQTVGVGGTAQTSRAELNLIAGSNVTLSAADNAGANRTDVTINAAGGGGAASAAVITASNATWPIPAGATMLEIVAVGGGGGGGGGGTNSAAAAQVGGSGGGSGGQAMGVFPVGANTTLNVTIGTVGAGGNAGNTGGNAGTNGSVGGTTSVSATGISLSAPGGTGGQAGPASNTTPFSGGAPGAALAGNQRSNGPSGSFPQFPGCGGANSALPAGLGGPPLGYAGGGGGGAGQSTTTTPGSAGSAGTSSAGGGYNNISSSGTTGAAGGSAAANTGAGGGGGAGAPSSSTAGAGGTGGSGYVIVKVVG